MLKKRNVPTGMLHKHRIPDALKPSKVIVITHQEIFTEMQVRYPELYDLSLQTGHELLKKLSDIIRDRLSQLMRNNPEIRTSCFQLSKAYRKAHPHFGDFQCILSTLHQIEDADVSGKPRTQLNEADLMKPSSPHMINDVPFNEIKASNRKYSDRICKKVAEHIQGLNAEPESGLQTEEDAARTRVRAELNKMQPYLPTIIKQVMSKYLIPENKQFYKIRIYGEPFIPPFPVMKEFLARWQPRLLGRSDRLYNLIRCEVAADLFDDLMSMDGTHKGGAKLIIRCCNPRLFYPPRHVVNQMKREFGDSYDERDGTYEYEDDERDAALDEPLDEMLDQWH